MKVHSPAGEKKTKFECRGFFFYTNLGAHCQPIEKGQTLLRRLVFLILSSDGPIRTLQEFSRELRLAGNSNALGDDAKCYKTEKKKCYKTERVITQTGLKRREYEIKAMYNITLLCFTKYLIHIL